MKTVGVRELRDRLSEVLRAVEEAGEIVEVTNHGRVVARLVPVYRPPLAASELVSFDSDHLTRAAAIVSVIRP